MRDNQLETHQDPSRFNMDSRSHTAEMIDIGRYIALREIHYEEIVRANQRLREDRYEDVTIVLTNAAFESTSGGVSEQCLSIHIVFI